MESWEILKREKYIPKYNRETKTSILSTLQEPLIWKNFMVRNDNNIFTIKGQNPIIDKNKKETIILDNDFYALFPKKIEWLYLLTEKENFIPLLPTSLIERFNHFLAGESEIKDNLYHGDCIDFVYALTLGEWVERDKNGELWTPNKEYFTP